MRKAILIILAAVLVFSCEREPQGEITLSKEKESMTAAGGIINLSVRANYKWTCNTGTQDIIFSTRTGEAGSTDITIDIPGNPEAEQREIIIKFNCENAKAVLTLTQEGAVFKMITIDHSSTLFSAPLFDGSGFTGTVEWGDGTSDKFSAREEAPVHEYKSAETRTVSVSVHDSDEFTIPSMSSVTKIDLSSF